MPGRARAAPLPPRGGPCSSGLIRPALLTQETGRRGPLSVPNRCPLFRFRALAPRCVRVLADRGPTRSSRAQRVEDSWLKPCPRSCRALCAWQSKSGTLCYIVPSPCDSGWSLRPTRDGKGEPTVKMNFSCSTARSKANRGVKMYRAKFTSGAGFQNMTCCFALT